MSTQIPLNRRRSRSTSAPSSPIPRTKHDDTWSLSSKRACPPSPGYVSYPQKWEDVDMWRRGKRTCRDMSSPRSDNIDSHPIRSSSYSFSLGGGSSSSASASSSAPPTPHFATTSAEFNLFPKRHSTKSSSSSSHPQSDPASLSTDNLELDSKTDLTQLRSDAFWELRRSVAENGEGLVRRMRDYESSRSRAGVYSKAKDSLRRGRKRYSLSTRPRRTIGVDDGSDAEDDIQIFSGNEGDAGSARKKRALSVGMADSHAPPKSPFTDLHRNERCFSPTTTFGSGPSAYTSDDEDSMDLVNDSPLSVSAMASSPAPPALSHSFTTSNSSSVISLSSHFFGIPSLEQPHHPTIPTSPSSSRSEKAIAALSLALANGSGGINDYEALRAVETAPIVEDIQVGELWH